MSAKKDEPDLENFAPPVELIRHCAWCGRVQDTDGVWRKKDRSTNRRSGVYVTHGACPVCVKKLRLELHSDDKDKKDA